MTQDIFHIHQVVFMLQFSWQNAQCGNYRSKWILLQPSNGFFQANNIYIFFLFV